MDDGISSPGVSAVSVRLTGRVQGVGFRRYCQLEGRRLGLSGWVRNLSDGGVEVWAEGPAVKLDDFLQWLRRGPPGARVDSFQYDTHAPTGRYGVFTVV
jgi:acylphosphatase